MIREGRISLLIAMAIAAISAVGAMGKPDPGPSWADVSELGATFSVYSYGQAPYNRAAPFLGLEARTRFSEGAEAFAELHADSTMSGNGTSCESCHFRDGRGRAHAAMFNDTGFSVINPASAQDRLFRRPAVFDPDAIALGAVDWVVVDKIPLPGGEVAELVRPAAIVGGIERPADLRNATSVSGLGLLEAIADRDIVARAQARSFVWAGVTGRIGIARDAQPSSKVGRFGWKSSFATLEGQVHDAVANELGLPVRAGEASDLSAKLATYLRFLAVPARRLDGSASARLGAARFEETGCAMCHTPSWQTQRGAGTPATHRGLTIYPFTDLLLHDMGAGLRDPSRSATARLWRTAPLWGVGVQRGVAPDAGYLHDGRARTLTEAILWHGGEAEHAIALFKALTPAARAELLAFLASL